MTINAIRCNRFRGNEGYYYIGADKEDDSRHRGDDTIEGKGGDDLIESGEGDNVLTGGRGKDEFKISTIKGSYNVITDYEPDQDGFINSSYRHEVKKIQFNKKDPSYGNGILLSFGHEDELAVRSQLFLAGLTYDDFDQLPDKEVVIDAITDRFNDVWELFDPVPDKKNC